MSKPENYHGVFDAKTAKPSPRTIACSWVKPYRVIQIIHECGNVTMYHRGHETLSGAEAWAKSKAKERGYLGESFAVLDMRGFGPTEVTA